MVTEGAGTDATTIRRLRVMGVGATVTVVGGEAHLAESAERRLGQLERIWSRFLPHSDISRLNTAEGAWTAVSPETLVLLAWMKSANAATGTLFNPTLLPATVALGDTVSRTDPSRCTVLAAGSTACSSLADIDLDESLLAARLPAEMALDPGGIAKGLAADIVTEELMAAGAAGACVNVGGDLRCSGDSGEPGGWLVEIRSGEQHDHLRWTITIREGAVATSSTLARRWNDPEGRPAHHVLDPATRRPSGGRPEDLQLVSVVSALGAWCEAFTKAVLVAGWDAGVAMASGHDLAVAALTEAGTELTNDAWEAYVR